MNKSKIGEFMKVKRFSGNKLKDKMDKIGITYNEIPLKMWELAKVEVSQNTVRLWVKENRNPGANNLMALAKVLGIKMEDLFE